MMKNRLTENSMKFGTTNELFDRTKKQSNNAITFVRMLANN